MWRNLAFSCRGFWSWNSIFHVFNLNFLTFYLSPFYGQIVKEPKEMIKEFKFFPTKGPAGNIFNDRFREVPWKLFEFMSKSVEWWKFGNVLLWTKNPNWIWAVLEEFNLERIDFRLGWKRWICAFCGKFRYCCIKLYVLESKFASVGEISAFCAKFLCHCIKFLVFGVKLGLWHKISALWEQFQLLEISVFCNKFIQKTARF